VGFVLLSLAAIAFCVGVLLLVGRAYPGSGADLVDWKPTRSYEDEALLELEDVQQMIEAQNEYRRKRGADPITEQDVRRQAAEDDATRMRGRGPFGHDPDADLEG
jgi:uncharacterized protein YkwD